LNERKEEEKQLDKKIERKEINNRMGSLNRSKEKKKN